MIIMNKKSVIYIDFYYIYIIFYIIILKFKTINRIKI